MTENFGQSASHSARIAERRLIGAARHLARSFRSDEIWLTAAGLAFAALFAAIPAAAVAASLYGLIADPDAVGPPVERLEGLLPEKASGYLADRLREVANVSKLQLGAGVGGAFLVAFWSAQAGAAALVASLYVAYGEQECRSFACRQLIALAVALCAGLFGISAFVVFSVLPLGPQDGGSSWLAVSWVRWPTLALAMAAALALLYRWAPSRRAAKLRWIAPGAASAAVLWLVGGFAFSHFVLTSEAYEKVFVTLGAFLMLLSWFYWTALSVLFGAQLNAALERQISGDTTAGPDLPIGLRGAAAADKVDRLLRSG